MQICSTTSGSSSTSTVHRFELIKAGFFLSFYMELFAAESAWPQAIQHLHEGLPQLSLSETDEF